jgi:hypothetical protein
MRADVTILARWEAWWIGHPRAALPWLPNSLLRDSPVLPCGKTQALKFFLPSFLLNKK